MSLPRLNRPQRLAFWQIDSATPVQVDTDLYWTEWQMAGVDSRLATLRLALNSQSLTGRMRVALLDQQAGLCEEWGVLYEHREDLESTYRTRMWLRAYLVTSSDGHIHSGPYCTTFKARTTATLLPQASGMTHAELVDAVGERGCTICFPDAPVKPTTLRDPLTAQEQDAKAAEQAEKQAQAAAKAITTPEGAPLYTATTKASGGFRDQDLIKTEIAAQRRATSTLKDLGWYGLGFDDTAADIETFKRMIFALATKQDRSVRELVDEYFDKGKKAVLRDGGEMLLGWDDVMDWFSL